MFFQFWVFVDDKESERNEISTCYKNVEYIYIDRVGNLAQSIRREVLFAGPGSVLYLFHLLE